MVSPIKRSLRIGSWSLPGSDTFFLLGAALIVALVASFMLRKLAYLAVGGAH